MKKYIITTLFITIGFIAKAQEYTFTNNTLVNVLLSSDTSNDIAHDAQGNAIKIDSNSNGRISVAEANNVYDLNLNQQNLTSIEGIECFPNLVSIDVSENALTNINILNQLTILEVIACNNNAITSINFTNLSQLSLLYCYNNQITTLELSNATNLNHLDCSYNLLTTLNVTNANYLTILDCSHNYLTSLNLHTFSNLNKLYCNTNSLTTLDVSSLSNLTTCIAHSNNLSSLYLKNGVDYSLLNSQGYNFKENPNISYICADTSKIDDLALYFNIPTSSITSSCGNTNTTTNRNSNTNMLVFPNPTKGELNLEIPANESIEKITIYNLAGQPIYTTYQATNTLNISNINEGIYFVEATTNSNKYNKQVIKK